MARMTIGTWDQIIIANNAADKIVAYGTLGSYGNEKYNAAPNAIIGATHKNKF